MDLVQALKNTGLSEKEAKVYIALLQIPRATAYTVARNSGLKRPTVYVVLEDLIDKGIVQKVPRVKKAQYIVIPPEELFGMIKNKIQTAESVLPELKALGRGKQHKVNAYYYEGLDGIKEMYKKMLKTAEGREVVGFYAHEKDTSEDVRKYWKELNDGMRYKNIKRRGITTNDPSLKEYLNKATAKKYNIKIKALSDKKYSSNISIDVYKNYTQIISHRYLQGVLIDNPDIANVLKQIFELVWERDDIVEKEF